ncbi:MAG: GYD domain-containing protein [SAR202 cluster bacterium]|jgi:uncharacterized protein with GYD domain|nr:GYD domain-containing protein [SAR202 cluster bacterium]MDP6715579.1 GYD domain-containing protein [SAR202 cluster bacterium]
MANYILLLTFTPEGRERMVQDPDCVQRAVEMISIPDTETLGLYAVLGEYDFVNILTAPNNETAARFSMELGVLAGVHVTTMAAIPVARLEDSLNQEHTWREHPWPEGPEIDDSTNGH